MSLSTKLADRILHVKNQQCVHPLELRAIASPVLRREVCHSVSVRSRNNTRGTMIGLQLEDVAACMSRDAWCFCKPYEVSEDVHRLFCKFSR